MLWIRITFDANPDSLYPSGAYPVTDLFDANPKTCESGSGTLVFSSYLTFQCLVGPVKIFLHLLTRLMKDKSINLKKC